MKEDLQRFTQLSKQYGVLFHPVLNKQAKNGIIDILANKDDAGKINRMLEVMQYPVPGKETAGKNAPSRAPHEPKLNERGSGFMEKIRSGFVQSRGPEPDKAGQFEGLGPEVLAALVLHIANENMRSQNPSTLSRLMAKGQGNLQVVQVRGLDAPTLLMQAETLQIPLHLQETGIKGEYIMTAPTQDAAMINRLIKQQGIAPPLRLPEPEKAPEPPPKQRKEKQKETAQSKKKEQKPSIKDKVQQAKEDIKPPSKKQGRPPKSKDAPAPIR